MAKITVKVRADIGDPGTHPKYGALKPGDSVTIDEADFGAGLFERPSADFLSPHEKADRDRAAELKQRVGDQEPPVEKQKKSAPATAAEEGKEV
jgi:hypothetical protein